VVFENRARGSDEPRVAVAGEVKARIDYTSNGRTWDVSPAVWIDSLSPTTISVGDERELVLTYVDSGGPQRLYFMSDRRGLATENRFLTGPVISENVTAKITLTVDGIIQPPIEFAIEPPTEFNRMPNATLRAP